MSWRTVLRLLFVASALFIFALPVSAATLPTSATPFTAPSPDATCASEASSKSITSATATSFTITNNTTLTLSIYWLNFQGKRVKYFDLAPGGVATQPTYQTHPWVVAYPDGTCVHLFTVTGPLQVTIGQATTSPVVNLTQARLEGVWQLQSAVTAVAPNTTGITFPPGAVPPVGAHGLALVNFVPNCARPTACDLNALEATPGSASATQSEGGLIVPGAGQYGIYNHAGNTYTYLPYGFGSSPCVGSFTHYFTTGMTLNVTAASQVGDTLLATRISGSGHVLGASCVNGAIYTFSYFIAINQGIPLSSVSPTPSAGPVLPSLPGLPAINSSTSQPPISKALASPVQVFSSPAHTLLNIVVAAAVVLFITFPAQLFNHTLEENWAEIRRRVVRFLHLSKRFEVATPVAEGSQARNNSFVFFLVLAIGTLLGALLNPHFGLNLPTLLALVATLITIAWGLWLSYRVARAYRKVRHTDVAHYFKALPAGLVVAGVCLLVSRLTDFQPGYLYGLVYSVAFTGKLQKHQEGQLITLSTIISLALAVLAWFAWAPLHNIAITGPLAIPLLLATSVLASLFVGGLVGSIIGLVPLRFLSGHKLFSWHRTVWASTFGLAVFLFLQVLLLPAKGGHTTTASLVTALVLLAVFGAISVAFWWYFARRKPSLAEKAESGDAELDEHTVGVEGEAADSSSPA